VSSAEYVSNAYNIKSRHTAGSSRTVKSEIVHKFKYALRLKNKLYEAIEAMDITALEFAIAAGADVNQILQGGKTALGLCMEKRYGKMIDLLLDRERPGQPIMLGVQYSSEAGDEANHTALDTTLLTKDVNLVEAIFKYAETVREVHISNQPEISSTQYQVRALKYAISWAVKNSSLPMVECIL